MAHRQRWLELHRRHALDPGRPAELRTASIVDPCIPADWKQFQVTRQWRGATFQITVTNPNGVEKGVRSVTFNGDLWTGPIPPQPAGSVHRVEVVMG